MSGKENVCEKLSWCWKIWLGGRSGWKMGSELEIGKINVEDVVGGSISVQPVAHPQCGSSHISG